VSDISQSSRTPRPNGNGAHAEGEGLSADLAALRDDVGRLADSVAQMLTGRAGSATGQLRDTMNETYATASEAAGIFQRAGSGLYEDASSRLGTMTNELEQTVRRAPLTAVALAALLGVVYGMIRR
jgi:ElaB/YqjD/DUF883 family membrane-anchored ribosome-binding protein